MNRILIAVCLVICLWQPALAAKWVDGDKGSTLTAVVSGTGDVQGKAAATNLKLVGAVIHENAGAVAQLKLRHGTADTDPIIGVWELAANETQVFFFERGVDVEDGIFVERDAGTTELTLFTVLED